MIGFSQAVETAQAWWRERLESGGAPPELVASANRSELAPEALQVEECVRRFAETEVEGRTAIGRYPGIKAFPALHDLVSKQLTRLAADEREKVAEAVGIAVARGYTFLASMESQQETAAPPDRTAREIWDIWAPNINTGMLERSDFPEDVTSFGRAFAASAFQEDGARLGLTGFGKKTRLRHLGGYYAQAGMVLRAIQTTPSELRPDPVNPWKYDDYPYA